MSKSNPLAILAVAGAMILSLGAFLFGGAQGVAQSFGNTSGTSTTQAIVSALGLRSGTQGLRVGASGTFLARINTGFCNLHTGSDTSIAASSTETWDCQAGTGTFSALTGVTAGDACFVSMSTTSPSTFQGLRVNGTSASSTPGAIVLSIFNGTGAAYTWGTAASSSLQYTCIDNF